MASRSLAERIIAIAALLVPARLRADWQREWTAELASVTDPAAPLTRYALGAFTDAFWIR